MSDPYRTPAKPFAEPPPKRSAAKKREDDIAVFYGLQATNIFGRSREELDRLTKVIDEVRQRIQANKYVDD